MKAWMNNALGATERRDLLLYVTSSFEISFPCMDLSYRNRPLPERKHLHSHHRNSKMVLKYSPILNSQFKTVYMYMHELDSG